MPNKGQQPNRPETYLTPPERATQRRLFSAVEEFPPAFIAWLDDHLRVNVPRFPVTQVQGFNTFQQQIEQLTLMLTQQNWSFIDAKGDLIVGVSDDHFSTLQIGGASNGYVLTLDSTQPTGMKWAISAASGGLTSRELQVKFGLDTTAVSAGDTITVGITQALADLGTLSDCRAFVAVTGSSDTTVDLSGGAALSTNLTIGSGDHWDDGTKVISDDTVALEDLVTITVVSAGTGAKGLGVTLTFG